MINRLQIEALENAADVKRAKLGFAWSEIAIDPDWDAFYDFDRVYPTELDLDTLSAEAQNHLKEILAELKRLTALEEQEDGLEEKDIDLFDALEDAQRGALVAYVSEDLARAGVIAVWRHSRVEFMVDMVRPENRTDQGASKASSSTLEQTGPKRKSLKRIWRISAAALLGSRC